MVLTRGREGVLVADGRGVCAVPAVPAQVVDVTGAGDALVAGTLLALLAGRSPAEAVGLGTVVAALTVQSEHSVRPDLSARLVETRPVETREVRWSPWPADQSPRPESRPA